MGGLVQQPAPARADRKHPTRRGRSPLPRARRDPIFGRVTQANLPPANSVRFTPSYSHHCGSAGKPQQNGHHRRIKQAANAESADHESSFAKPSGPAGPQQIANKGHDAVDRETLQKHNPETDNGLLSTS